jgi:hypothetical protein
MFHSQNCHPQQTTPRAKTATRKGDTPSDTSRQGAQMQRLCRNGFQQLHRSQRGAGELRSRRCKKGQIVNANQFLSTNIQDI